jgi:hypothetical protein
LNISLHTFTFVYIHIYTNSYICVYIFIYTYVYSQLYVNVYMYIYMYMCVYLFIYICANSIIHHSNMYSVTYIHACIVFALVYFCTLDTYTRIQIYFFCTCIQKFLWYKIFISRITHTLALRLSVQSDLQYMHTCIHMNMWVYKFLCVRKFISFVSFYISVLHINWSWVRTF